MIRPACRTPCSVAISQDPLYLGLFHQREATTFEDHMNADPPSQSERHEQLEQLFDRYS